MTDANGNAVPVVMGSYGIGIGRNMAAVAEAHHDERGLVWPVSVAPFEVVVTQLSLDDDPTVRAAEAIYRRLLDAGIEALLDDRDARPGVKFADAELIGVPYRVTVGPKGLADGQVELQERSSGESRRVAVDDVADVVTVAVLAAR